MSDESAQQRKDMRGHQDGNVRPADGRYGLHEPSEESLYVTNDATADDSAPRRRQRTRKGNANA